jgi:hypothetical protein
VDGGGGSCLDSVRLDGPLPSPTSSFRPNLFQSGGAKASRTRIWDDTWRRRRRIRSRSPSAGAVAERSINCLDEMATATAGQRAGWMGAVFNTARRAETRAENAAKVSIMKKRAAAGWHIGLASFGG